jgi:hypothetical protein
MLIQPTPIHLNEKTAHKTNDADIICVPVNLKIQMKGSSIVCIHQNILVSQITCGLFPIICITILYHTHNYQLV